MRVKLYIQYVADLHYADAEPDCQIEKMRIRKPLRKIHDCCRSFLTLFFQFRALTNFADFFRQVLRHHALKTLVYLSSCS